MTETTALTVQPRTIIGKASRRLAAEGQIPAVLYGAGREALALSVDRHAFEVLMSHQGGGSTLVALSVEGEDEAVNTIIKELQKSPVKGTVMHIDFLAIRMDEAIEASVALNLVGDSEGVKSGGILMQNATTVLVSVLPADLPDSIDIDISELEVGDNRPDVRAAAGRLRAVEDRAGLPRDRGSQGFTGGRLDDDLDPGLYPRPLQQRQDVGRCALFRVQKMSRNRL